MKGTIFSLWPSVSLSKNCRGSLGSENLNWRAPEPEILPDPTTDTARNQGGVIPQAAAAGFGKIDSTPDHQDYVTYLREGTYILFYFHRNDVMS